jgi:hypothetical protein
MLPDSTPRSSKKTINIAGFFVYLYGIDELTPEQAKDTTVLFHIHGRTRTYKDAEEIAHQLLYELRERGGTKKGLVVATLDNRNHGMRAVCSPASVVIDEYQQVPRSIILRCKLSRSRTDIATDKDSAVKIGREETGSMRILLSCNLKEIC